MKTTSDRASIFSRASEMLLPALSVLFGLQLLRVMIPQLTWILGDRFGLSALVLGPIALAIFSFSFFAGFLKHVTGSYRLATFSAAGLGLARFLVQVQWSEPLIDLAVSAVGAILFGIYLSAYIDTIRSGGSMSAGNLVTGLLTGFILDTALHGFYATYDQMWRPDFSALLITIGLVLLHWLTIVSFSQRVIYENMRGDITWPWLAFGPFLFLQMVVLQNIARHTVTTGWLPSYVFGLVMIAQTAGLITVVLLLKTNFIKLPVVIAGGIILVAGSIFAFPDQSWLAAILLMLEQVSISILIAAVITGISGSQEIESGGSITAANGTGSLLFGILVLAYYSVYQIKLPYSNTALEVVAAVIVAFCAFVSCYKTGNRAAPVKTSLIALFLALALLFMPLNQVTFHEEPVEVEGAGFPVKVMTYNLHNGFNTLGDLDMEAIAMVIEENDPDIIALQEISRGWLVSGRVDMLEWLSRRLDMPYISGPTEGRLWGSAILSRFPVMEFTNYELPPRDLFIRRGYLAATIDVGNGEYLNVIATHLHHIPGDSEIRQQQVPVILETWSDAEMTLITGDLNAEPDSPEIRMLRDAGLIDVMSGSIPPAGYTYHAADLYQRIDYIWITPDLKSSNAKVIQSTASDHLPVIVEIDK